MIEQTDLDGVLIITPRVFSDGRGAFSETYNAETLVGFGIHTAFVQDNQLQGREAGTLVNQACQPFLGYPVNECPASIISESCR